MSPRFVHLNVHSEYSLLDSLIRIPRLLDESKKGSIAAIAVTDRNNLFAAAKFIRAAEETGIKPIIGSEIEILSGDPNVGSYRKTLLCSSRAGFEGLCEILTELHRSEVVGGRISYSEEELFKKSFSGLIGLSGDLDGDIGKLILAGKLDAAKERLIDWNNFLSGSYFCQISRLGRDFEERYISSISRLVGKKIGLVATNQVRFLEEGDYEAHDARICIQESRLLSDPKRNNEYFRSQFLKTENQMIDLFRDIPSSLQTV